MDLVHELNWKTQVTGEVTDLSCRELIAMLNGGRFALIAAPQARYAELGEELNGAGYSISSAVGVYAGHPKMDRIYIVQNPREADIVALGQKYGQDSVVIGESGTQRMIFTGRNVERKGKGWRLAAWNESQFTQVETSDGQTVRFRLEF